MSVAVNPVRTAAVGMLLTLAAAGVAMAAEPAPYPSHLIKIIVPFPAGGLNDTVARILQPHLQTELGQTVIVENRPGASGTIGTDAVAKSPADGHTLLLVASSHAVTPSTTKIPYDTERDFAPVCLIAQNPLLFVAAKTVPAKTLAEFVALAKSKPGGISYATPGSGSQSRLVTEQFSQLAGIKMLEIPYRGGAPAMLALMTGEVQFAVLSTQLSAPQIESGKIIALASGGRTRDPNHASIPTLRETGYAMDALQWVGLLAPAGTDGKIIARLNAVVRQILGKPDVVAKMATQGLTAAPDSAEAFRSQIAREVALWAAVAKKAGIAAR
jgi:tripartite-type tricarboxylate transporter receptor subunit TctC